eukprot:5050323-Pyramimonas_sp.AAC.1
MVQIQPVPQRAHQQPVPPSQQTQALQRDSDANCFVRLRSVDSHPRHAPNTPTHPTTHATIHGQYFETLTETAPH